MINTQPCFAIETENLAYSYNHKEDNIFEQLSFKAKKGEVVAFLGPNGCGKTTLINCLLGYFKPTAGNILVQGKNIAAYKPKELAKQISYVPQAHKKVFPFTVLEVVSMGRMAYTSTYGAPREADLAIAAAALAKVGLKDLQERPYMNLSGGQSQLVMLARAIAQDAAIIILDEPTAHLDAYNEMLVLDQLQDYVKNSNTTVIMSSHSPNQLFYLASLGMEVSCGLIQCGKLLAYGECAKVLTTENLRNLYQIENQIVEVEGNEGRTKIKQMINFGVLKPNKE